MRRVIGLLGLVVLPLAGCVPSDADIAFEMKEGRREAYQEWKNMRDRGESRDAMVNGGLALDDAIKLALQYNKPLQSAVQEREVARGERISAYAVVLPNAVLTAGASRLEKGRGNSDIDRYSAGVTVTQPLFEGEKIPATLRTARLNTALVDEKIREQVQELIQAVSNNYYDILLAQHMVEVQREALNSAEAQYRTVSEKREQETATHYDVLRTQVDVATYRAKMISEQNTIDTNRVALLKNLGVSQDSNIILADKLEFLPMRPVFERAVEIASGNRPDLRQALLDSRIAEEAVKIARSAWWPSLAGTFEQTWEDGWGVRDSFGRNPWQAGLTATYTLGIDNAGELQSAKARAKQSQLAILDKQEDALRQIRQEMNNLANAEEMVKALVVSQDSAREALRLVLVGYEAGIKTEVDVNDARKALTDVMGQYYTSLADHTKARLNLQMAMGVLGPADVSNFPLPSPKVPVARIEEFAVPNEVLPLPVIDLPGPDMNE